MTVDKPDISPFGLYTGRQAAKLLGVDRHTLTRWKRSLLLAPHTDDGRYLGKDLAKLWRGR